MDQKIQKIQCINEQQRKYCRICLQQQQPLIKLPCSCKGSLSYMHNSCLTNMLKVKQELQKQDVQDYIQVFSNNGNSCLSVIKAKCEICLNEIPLQKSQKLNWHKIFDVQIEVYIVLFGITGISMFGLNIAIKLLEKAILETGIMSRGMYFGAYVWIIGVILYVLFQPIYSEIKVTTYQISTSDNCKHTKNLKKQISYKDRIKIFLQRILLQAQKSDDGQTNSSNMKEKNRKSSRFDERVRVRPHSREKSRRNAWQITIKPKYYEI